MRTFEIDRFEGGKFAVVYLAGGEPLEFTGSEAEEFLDQWNKVVSVDQLTAQLQEQQRQLVMQAQQLQQAKQQLEQAAGRRILTFQ